MSKSTFWAFLLEISRNLTAAAEKPHSGLVHSILVSPLVSLYSCKILACISKTSQLEMFECCKIKYMQTLMLEGVMHEQVRALFSIGSLS